LIKSKDYGMIERSTNWRRLTSWPVRAYIFRGFISCFGADTPLTPPAAGYKAFFYLRWIAMNIKFYEYEIFAHEDGSIIQIEQEHIDGDGSDRIVLSKEQLKSFIESLKIVAGD